jgi:CheY-like chemotaxis protein
MFTNAIHEKMLLKLGICEDVNVVNNGLEALNVLKKAERKPDLIFLDINMPVLNGFEFIEKYQELYGHNQKSIIVVMLTTSIKSSDLRKANKSNVISEFISKPLKPEKLLQVREKYLSKEPISN